MSIPHAQFGCGQPIYLPNFRFASASSQHLISRLTARNIHLLALRISSFLDLKPEVVLKHWAAAKILHSQKLREELGAGLAEDDDAKICKLIVDKFESLGADMSQGVSYSEVAKKAWLAGRTKLATMVSIGGKSWLLRFIFQYANSFWIMNRAQATRCLSCLR